MEAKYSLTSGAATLCRYCLSLVSALGVSVIGSGMYFHEPSVRGSQLVAAFHIATT